jgi:hypothetical protein
MRSMALTRDFKQTVAERVQRDPAFARALLDEALGAAQEAWLGSSGSYRRSDVRAFRLRDDFPFDAGTTSRGKA